MTGMSGLVALISAVAEGNLCISWDLHQSGWTRALLNQQKPPVTFGKGT